MIFNCYKLSRSPILRLLTELHWGSSSSLKMGNLSTRRKHTLKFKDNLASMRFENIGLEHGYSLSIFSYRDFYMKAYGVMAYKSYLRTKQPNRT